MNFFEHQSQARRRTGLLIALFCLAVLSLIAMASLLMAAFLGYIDSPDGALHGANFLQQLNSHNILPVGLGVCTLIGGGTLYKLSQLSAGGKVVAEMLGGTRLEHQPGNSADERKLLNIVEEMAIASGTPVPAVYVLQGEPGINAFAAGFNLNDAVVAVTRGCMEALNRDELQGVIAHEFSHILHGDMRLNIRLMGLLHGILLIGLIGYQLLGRLWWTSGRRRDNNSAIGIVALAIGLIVIGFGGLLFGNLIKAAVSRQREYLADASAVQFTRNPDGIAGALKKIGGFSHGTLIRNPNAESASHLLFGAGTRHLISGLFATHPPLAERIRRLDRHWDGQFPVQRSAPPTSSTAPASAAPFSAASSGAAALATHAIASVGQPQPEHLAQARHTIDGLPALWHHSAQQALGARAVIYALLMDKEAQTIEHQFQHIRNLDADSLPGTQQLLTTREQIDEQQRLPLIDIALAQLGTMDKAQFADFSALVDALIRADQRISLFEWSLSAILQHHLKPLHQRRRVPSVRYRQLRQVRAACQTLFSLLAVADCPANSSAGTPDTAFAAAREAAALPELTRLPAEQLSIGQMNETLATLNQLDPLSKPQLLQACIACICADNLITSTETELIRAIADTLGCPMPPLPIPPQSV